MMPGQMLGAGAQSPFIQQLLAQLQQQQQAGGQQQGGAMVPSPNPWGGQQQGAQPQRPQQQQQGGGMPLMAGGRQGSNLPTYLPNPGWGSVVGGMDQMNSLGSLLGGSFGLANAQSSANAQASYGPDAAMNIARLNNDGENYRTNASLAAKLASLGMLGQMLGGMSGMLGGSGGGIGGFTGYQATDSPQMARFTGGMAPGAGGVGAQGGAIGNGPQAYGGRMQSPMTTPYGTGGQFRAPGGSGALTQQQRMQIAPHTARQF